MTTHSSILAWTVPWTEKPGGPQYLLVRVKIILLCMKYRNLANGSHTLYTVSFTLYVYGIK